MARVGNIVWVVTHTFRDPFSVDAARLPATGRTDEVELREGDAFDLSAARGRASASAAAAASRRR